MGLLNTGTLTKLSVAHMAACRDDPQVSSEGSGLGGNHLASSRFIALGFRDRAFRKERVVWFGDWWFGNPSFCLLNPRRKVAF